MKRQVLSFFLLVTMLFSLGSVAWADDTGIVPFSSDYLEGHSVYLRSSKTGRMAVDVTVEATDIADIVGIHSIYIEYQVNGRWKFYDTFTHRKARCSYRTPGLSLSKKSAKRQTFSCKDDKIGRKG